MLSNIRFATGQACVAAVLLLISGLVVWGGTTMPIGSLAVPGPGFFPIALGVLLAAASLMLLLQRQPDKADATVSLSHRNVAITVLALCGVALAFERLGAIPTLVLFLAFLFVVLARPPLWKAVALALCGGGLTWLLFVYLLNLQLPGV